MVHGGVGGLKDLQLLPGGVGPPQGLTPTAAPGGRTPPRASAKCWGGGSWEVRCWVRSRSRSRAASRRRVAFVAAARSTAAAADVPRGAAGDARPAPAASGPRERPCAATRRDHTRRRDACVSSFYDAQSGASIYGSHQNLTLRDRFHIRQSPKSNPPRSLPFFFCPFHVSHRVDRICK